MAADGQVNVNIKVTADTAGGAQAKASDEGVGKAAASAATQAKTSAGVFKTAFTSVGKAVDVCAKAIGGVTKALGVIGFAINAVQMIVDSFHKLHDWLHIDEIAAARLPGRTSIQVLKAPRRTLATVPRRGVEAQGARQGR